MTTGFPVTDSSHRRDPHRRATEDVQEETAKACKTSRYCCQEEEHTIQRESSLEGMTELNEPLL
jgi:hypothetical protein